MKTGDTLAFAHGFNIHYGYITPPEDVDVVMCAPKGPGHIVRRVFTEGAGVPVSSACTRTPRETPGTSRCPTPGASAGRAPASSRPRSRTRPRTDLFGEQAVLCGGVVALVNAGFETLVEAGYPPEMAYFECFHEMKLIVDLMYEGGMPTCATPSPTPPSTATTTPARR